MSRWPVVAVRSISISARIAPALLIAASFSCKGIRTPRASSAFCSSQAVSPYLPLPKREAYSVEPHKSNFIEDAAEVFFNEQQQKHNQRSESERRWVTLSIRSN